MGYLVFIMLCMNFFSNKVHWFSINCCSSYFFYCKCMLTSVFPMIYLTFWSNLIELYNASHSLCFIDCCPTWSLKFCSWCSSPLLQWAHNAFLFSDFNIIGRVSCQYILFWLPHRRPSRFSPLERVIRGDTPGYLIVLEFNFILWKLIYTDKLHFTKGLVSNLNLKV
jgi:hypothetical protein